MSDTSQGPGWWQASDGKWYPPEQAPASPPPGQAPGGVPASSVDIGAALAYGWKKFVQYLGQIVIIVVIILAVNILFQVIGSAVSGNGLFGTLLSLFFSIAAIFVSYLLIAGVIRAALAVTRGEEPDAGLLFKTDHLGSYIVASLLVSLGIFIGLFALCIGALIVAFFTFFYGFFVIDRGDAPVEAIKNSVNLVKDNLGGVLGFVIVATVLNVITCGLAYGVTYIAGAYVYRTLNGETVAP
jgi:uncharacterized membrane protein